MRILSVQVRIEHCTPNGVEMNIKHVSLIVVSGLGFCVGSAQAEPFVFQGQLNDNGSPADGIYDLEFELFGLDLGGTQIGPTVTLEDQTVTDGNFLVELDFGDAFDGSSRWIETSVRNGDSIDSFTTLAPRLKVGNSPQASYATKAGVADTLADPFWMQAPGIVVFGEDEGQDKFFFNRDRVIESSDVMVLHSAMNGPGGMTISSWANGMPYYGFATGGFTRAKTYYDPATDAWVVNKGGTDQIEVDSNNDVIITNDLIVGGSIISGDGPGSTVQYKSFTPESIFIGLSKSSTSFNSFAGAIVPQGSPTGTYLRTDLNLPHGASITRIEVIYVDTQISPNLQIQLSTRNLATMAFAQTLLGESSGGMGGVTQTMLIEPTEPIVIDNTVETYDLRMLSSTGVWPVAGRLGVRSVLIEYNTP